MRIIGGIHKGKVIKVAKDLPVRPTTDFAKEALFNILANKVDFEGLTVLDLFSGTGHISLEFASRGAGSVTAVDQSFKCAGFLRSISKDLKLEVNAMKGDVFDFIKNCTAKFDLIFADPPYDLATIPQIHEGIMKSALLKPNGILIIEHGHKTKLDDLAFFTQHRKYGNVNFSFFENKETESVNSTD